MAIESDFRSLHPEVIREEAELLTQEFFTATSSMGLSNREIGEILGVSEPTISRAKKREIYFSRTRSHQWSVAELLVKASQELTRIYDHPRKEKHWFTTYNHPLRAFPIDLIRTMEGLLEVVRHLEGREEFRKVTN
jgi:uncharacterized protein (DUF2384 family)